MRARVEGERVRSIVLAHQTAVFTRAEKLKPDVNHYLKKRRKKQVRNDPAGVARMFDRMIGRQGNGRMDDSVNSPG
jgi:hypothetical protein